MQISTWEQDFIVDTLELWDHLERLNVVFADPGILKVRGVRSPAAAWVVLGSGRWVVTCGGSAVRAPAGAKVLGAPP